MAQTSSLNPDNILRFLQVRDGGASTEEIAQALHLPKSERKALFKMLSKLKKRNAIVEVAAGVGSSRVDLQACKLEYSIVSPK